MAAHDVETLLRVGRQALAQGKLDQALPILSFATVNYPSDPRTWFALAGLQLKTGQRDVACLCFSKASELAAAAGNQLVMETSRDNALLAAAPLLPRDFLPAATSPTTARPWAQALSQLAQQLIACGGAAVVVGGVGVTAVQLACLCSARTTANCDAAETATTLKQISNSANQSPQEMLQASAELVSTGDRTARPQSGPGSVRPAATGTAAWHVISCHMNQLTSKLATQLAEANHVTDHVDVLEGSDLGLQVLAWLGRGRESSGPEEGGEPVAAADSDKHCMHGKRSAEQVAGHANGTTSPDVAARVDSADGYEASWGMGTGGVGLAAGLGHHGVGELGGDRGSSLGRRIELLVCPDACGPQMNLRSLRSCMSQVLGAAAAHSSPPVAMPRVCPNRVVVRAMLVESQELVDMNEVRLDHMREDTGLDYGPCNELLWRPSRALSVDGLVHRRLSEPCELLAVETQRMLQERQTSRRPWHVDVGITTMGRLDCVVAWMEYELSPDVWLSYGPQRPAQHGDMRNGEGPEQPPQHDSTHDRDSPEQPGLDTRTQDDSTSGLNAAQGTEYEGRLSSTGPVPARHRPGGMRVALEPHVWQRVHYLPMRQQVCAGQVIQLQVTLSGSDIRIEVDEDSLLSRLPNSQTPTSAVADFESAGAGAGLNGKHCTGVTGVADGTRTGLNNTGASQTDLPAGQPEYRANGDSRAKGRRRSGGDQDEDGVCLPAGEPLHENNGDGSSNGSGSGSGSSSDGEDGDGLAAGALIMPYHLCMLNDRQRTRRYGAGIAGAVRSCLARQAACGEPAGVPAWVLDVGAGTGLLSMMAAKAGSTAVIGVEREVPLAMAAASLAAANGLEDSVMCLHTLSSNLTLQPPSHEAAAGVQQPSTDRTPGAHLPQAAGSMPAMFPDSQGSGSIPPACNGSQAQGSNTAQRVVAGGAEANGSRATASSIETNEGRATASEIGNNSIAAVEDSRPNGDEGARGGGISGGCVDRGGGGLGPQAVIASSSPAANGVVSVASAPCLVVHEVFGSDPLSEHILTTMRHVKARVSGPHTQFLPGRFRVVAALAWTHSLYQARCNTCAGVPLHPVPNQPDSLEAKGSGQERLCLDPLQPWTSLRVECDLLSVPDLLLLTHPAHVLDFDLNQAQQPALQGTASMTLTACAATHVTYYAAHGACMAKPNAGSKTESDQMGFRPRLSPAAAQHSQPCDGLVGGDASAASLHGAGEDGSTGDGPGPAPAWPNCAVYWFEADCGDGGLLATGPGYTHLGHWTQCVDFGAVQQGTGMPGGDTPASASPAVSGGVSAERDTFRVSASWAIDRVRLRVVPKGVD